MVSATHDPAWNSQAGPGRLNLLREECVKIALLISLLQSIEATYGEDVPVTTELQYEDDLHDGLTSRHGLITGFHISEKSLTLTGIGE